MKLAAHVSKGLEGVSNGLALVDTLGEDQGWLATGFVLALEGALIAALAGYDTANEAALYMTLATRRRAGLALLLKRARSSHYLTPPERVELSADAIAALARLQVLRNAHLHASPETCVLKGTDAAHALHLIKTLVFDAPAFKPDAHALRLASIETQLDLLFERFGRLV